MNSDSEQAGTVVISGASSGIGRATAELLAERGWLVFAGVRRLSDAPTARRSGSIVPLLLDVTDDDSVRAARSAVDEQLGGRRLDALINNAGIGVMSPVETVDLSELRQIYEVNVFGAVRVIQTFLELMGDGSRLLVTGSVGDRISLPFGAPLTSAKWAIASIAEALRMELVPRGIRVTIIEPGSIRTDGARKVEEGLDASFERLHHIDPPLAARFIRAARIAMRHEKSGSSPDVVAAAIQQTLVASRPPSRVLVGKHARLLATVGKLPDRVLDQLRLRMFAQPVRT